MNLIQNIPFGGTYRELWDDAYKLKIEYYDQKSFSLIFDGGKWNPLYGSFPDLALATCYFPQAASAAVAVARYVASGLTVLNLSELAPDGCSGPVFAAECMRILMDHHGMQMETIYPYIAPCFTDSFSAQQLDELSLLQPRTRHVLQILQEQLQNTPPVKHDLRLSHFRSPFGAVSAGQELYLAIHSPLNVFDSVFVELFGDDLSLEYPMEQYSEGWQVRFRVPKKPAALWYRFRLHSESGVRWLCTAPDGIHSWLRNSAHDGFRLTVFLPGFTTPEWFRHAVMYQVFPDRFAFSNDGTAEAGIQYHRELGQNPELHSNRTEEVRWQARAHEKDYIPDDFYGGTLKGIQKKLPYLHELGITCLYLNPIVEARSNHRYDTSDYLKVDPILGSNEDFENLCEEASRYGIRILCDGVFSHTGADSIYFNRDGHYPAPGACQKEESPYDSWYDFQHFPDEYRSWWGFHELPEVNENDPAWRNFVVTGDNSVVRHWLRLGASGWRLDVADELPDEVLALIRHAAKQEKPDSMILGEVWEDAVLKESYGARRRYALGYALDSVMNYPFRTAVLDFLHHRINAFSLADFLTSQQVHYPKPLYECLMNLLGSHDVERLCTNLASDICWKELSREKQMEAEKMIAEEDYRRSERLMCLAAAIQFSIPGVPSIYYGDEIALKGTNDPFNRRPMQEIGNSTLRDYIRSLSSLRRESSAWNDGKAFFLANDQDVLLILRSAAESILTVINRADTLRPYSLDYNSIQAAGTVEPCTALILKLSGSSK